MIEFWQHIYEHIDPIAFSLFGFKVHWYAIMYITALIVGYLLGVRFGKALGIEKKIIDEYFFWAEIGIIFGARVGYVVFYMPDNSYYLTHPWEMFNPFVNGKLVGISGMSYHGAVVGFLIASYLFARKYKVSFFKLMDVTALAVPLAYIFGRLGNFLNGLIVGRETTVPWGVYIQGALRHPIGIYEAFFEGFLLFFVVYGYYKKFYKQEGELIGVYAIGYGVFRSLCELWRRPDPQLGFIIGNLTMGQILSFALILAGIIWIYWRRK